MTRPQVRSRAAPASVAGPEAPAEAECWAEADTAAREPRDAGVATVLVLALTAVLLALGGGAIAVVGVAVARSRAASAADLAALAAADTVLEGAAEACAAASRTANAVGASVQSCQLVGDVAEVLVAVRPAGPLGRVGEARVRARAGPAPTVPQRTARLPPARAGPAAPSAA